MKRRLFNILALASLAFAVAISAALMVAWFYPFRVHLHSPEQPLPRFTREDFVSNYEWLNDPLATDGPPFEPTYDCGIFPWTVYFRKSVYISTQIQTPSGWAEFDSTPYEPFIQRLPLGIRVFRVWHGGATSFVCTAPVPLVLVLLTIFPGLWLFRRRRHANHPGLCANCHYDLRASQHRCPECGKPILSQHAA